MDDGFTDDVMTLLTIGGPDRVKQLRKIMDEVRGDSLDDFIRDGVIASLCPIMQNVPDFVKQIVARALLEHVDWSLIASWVRAENN